METMKSYLAFCSIVVPILLVFGDLGDTEVVHLNDKIFEQTLQGRDLVLVNFYISKGCDSCYALESEFSRAAAILKSSKPNAMLADIDCDGRGEVICRAYRLNKYPTMIGFRRGEIAFIYNGLETSGAIVEYILAQSNPFVTELRNLQELSEYLLEYDSSVIGFFQELNTDESLLFEKAVVLLSDRYRFGLCRSEEILKEYGYRMNDIVIFQADWMLNELEPSQLKYTDQPLASSFIPWIKSNIFGLAGLRTRRNMEEFERPLIVVYFDINFVKKPQQIHFWRNRVLSVAKNVSGEVPELKFALSDALDFKDELNEYKLSFDTEKPVVAARDIFNQKFVLREDFTVERLQKFAEDLAHGRLKPYLKSQAIPLENYKPVKVVVADSFDSIVNDRREDVFLQLCDPESPPCQELDPVMEDLAEQLKEEYAVVIANIDVVGNELPLNFKAEEFPTFYFARKRQKAEPLLYEGEHSVSDFIKFIAQHASYPLRTFGLDGRKLPAKKEL